jgi:hypothetical protein
LVAQGFPATCRHQDEGVPGIHDPLYDFLLVWPEFLQTENSMERIVNAYL